MCGKQRWSLMVLEMLDTLGPTESLGAFEQTSGDLLAVNHGTLYPAPLKLEQEGYISSQPAWRLAWRPPSRIWPNRPGGPLFTLR
jgi:hypothetical protein